MKHKIVYQQEMTDPYANIRKALAMGPTPGPWDEIQSEGSGWTDIYQGGNRRCATPIVYVPPCSVLEEHCIWKESKDETIANAKYVAACDPDTIRALLAERDELAKDAERYRWLRKGAVDDVAVVRGLGAMDYGMSGVAYTYSEEIDGDDLDAAIDAAMAKGDEI